MNYYLTHRSTGRRKRRRFECYECGSAIPLIEATTVSELVKTVTYYESNMEREINVSIVGTGVSMTNAPSAREKVWAEAA